jgi:MFS family permease
MLGGAASAFGPAPEPKVAAARATERFVHVDMVVGDTRLYRHRLSMAAERASLPGPDLRLLSDGAGESRLARYVLSYRAVLAIRDARLLLGALLISATGTWAYSAGLLALVYGRTHSLSWVGAAGVARFLPAVILGPFGGILVERADRFRLEKVNSAVATLLQVLLAIVALTTAPIALALLCAAGTSSCDALERSLVGATLPVLVPERHLVAANAMQTTIDSAATVVGPALGALILLVATPGAVFVINAVSFAIAALLTARIRHRAERIDVTEGGTIGLGRQLRVGLAAILTARSARVLVALSALVSAVYGADTVLFVAVSAHKLGTGTNGFTYLLAGLGLGGVLMAGTVDRLAAHPRLAWVIVGGVVGYTVPTALMIVVHSPVLAALIQVVRGGATLLVQVLVLTALHRSVPLDRLARVMGLFWALVLTAVTIGAAVTSPVIGAIGLNKTLVLMGGAPMLLALCAVPALLAVDRETAATSATLAPRIVLLERLDIFTSASRRLLESLARECQDRHFAAGEQIIAEGEVADALYVLLSGSVEATATGSSGEFAAALRTMNAPAYFGEIGILMGIPRTANVVATSDCSCAVLEASLLREALTDARASPALRDGVRTRLERTTAAISSEDAIPASA